MINKILTAVSMVALSATIALVSSCTYSINLIHSEGTATDLIDETQSPDVKPNIEIPLPKI